MRQGSGSGLLGSKDMTKSYPFAWLPLAWRNNRGQTQYSNYWKHAVLKVGRRSFSDSQSTPQVCCHFLNVPRDETLHPYLKRQTKTNTQNKRQKLTSTEPGCGFWQWRRSFRSQQFQQQQYRHPQCIFLRASKVSIVSLSVNKSARR